LPDVLYGYESRFFTFREEIILTVFENGVLKKVFGHEGDEVTGEQRRPHDEEFHEVCFSQNIIHVIKSRIMRWAGQGTRMGDSRDAYVQNTGGRNLRKRHHLEEPGLNRDMILNGSSRNRTGLNWLRIETSVGLLRTMR